MNIIDPFSRVHSEPFECESRMDPKFTILTTPLVKLVLLLSDV